jgi:CRP/FNR family cyclic AMP-dependent transcriptional regulator
VPQQPADGSGGLVRLLDEDPDLGSGLTAADLEKARQYAVASTITVRPGTYDPSTIGSVELLGLLVLEGLMIRGIEVAERRCGELVGPEALLRPWDHFGRVAPMPFEVHWRVIEPTRLAILDQKVMLVAARWPPLIHALMKRAVERSHALALNVAIHCLQHVEVRLLVLFWHLADRFGRVTSQGTEVPLKLTHRDLAELIGSQRPSVSQKLSELERRGQLIRRPDRTWMLPGDPPDEVRDLRARSGAGARP